MNTLKKTLSKGMIFASIIALLLMQTASAQYLPNLQTLQNPNTEALFNNLNNLMVDVSNPSASPQSFDPQAGEDLDIKFYVNGSANYTVEVLKETGAYLVWKGISKADTAGYVELSWDGKANTGTYSGNYVPAGGYEVKISAKKQGSPLDPDVEWVRNITVEAHTGSNVGNNGNSNGNNNGNNNGNTTATSAPTISNLSITPGYPSSFNPQAGETTEVKFSLNKTATYFVDVIKSGVVVRNITSASGSTAGAVGYQTKIWNGKNNSGAYVDEGLYMIRVKAQNSAGWAAQKTALVLIDYPAASAPTGNIPEITNDYAYPSPFNQNAQSTKIYYTLNTSAQVTITVLSGADQKTLKSTVTEGPGTYYATWDGTKANGTKVSNGDHTFKVIAQNTYGYDVEMGTIVANGGSAYIPPDPTPIPIPNPNAPNASGLYASPYSFNPLEENTNLCFTIDETSYVSMTIETGISAVKNLASADLYYAGTHCINWDGRNKWGEYSGAGTYNFTVLAINSDGSDNETSSVRVQYENNEEPEILNAYIVPHPYDPNAHGDANIYYNVDRKAKVTIKIKELDGKHRKTIMDKVWKTRGEHYKKWDGEDKYGNELFEGVYILYVKANNGFGSDIYETQIYIGQGAFVTADLCGGFYDVPSNSKYCQAILAAKSAGVFEGYEDGTFKPYQSINRAEAVKVILKALSKPILPPDGGNLGFWDLNVNHWYMPYLRTARMYGVIQGYGDGSFKPGNTINRSELLKVFLEATGIFIPLCQGQPYPDVPNSNPWYLKYACFAKQYDLVSTDGWGQFNPGTPMTRGDVADLFYRFEQQGLFSGAYYNN